MKNIKRLSLSLIAVLTLSGIGLVAPALAEDTATGRSLSPNPPTPVSSTSGDQKISDEVGLHPTDLTKRLQQNAETKLEAEKETVKEKSQADRTKACDNRQSEIQKRMANAVSKAETYQTRFDNIFAKAKTYHDNSGLTVDNYDALVAALTTDQQNIAASLTSLKSLNVTIDCSTPDTAVSSVSAFREAVQTTHDDLKQYRADLIKLLQALKLAASTGNTPSNNSTSQ